MNLSFIIGTELNSTGIQLFCDIIFALDRVVFAAFSKSSSLVNVIVASDLFLMTRSTKPSAGQVLTSVISLPENIIFVSVLISYLKSA